ncbi:MAG: DUF4145 domain-containing protein [Blastochloris sp.]|nr:DUF4145 domain-containing protein [Blastochloris sp.]
MDYNERVVCEISHNPPIFGLGSEGYAVLVVQPRMTLRGPKAAKHGYSFKNFQCKLSPFDGVYLTSNPLVKLDNLLGAGEEFANQVQIEFPISRENLERVESMRKSGDVRFRLDLYLSFDELVQLGSTPELGHESPIWGLKRHCSTSAQVSLHIPRSDWIERILPQFQLDRVHLIEIPAIPLKEVANFQASFEALKEAQEHHKQGFFNAAVMNCRQALEKLMDSQMEIVVKSEKKKVPALNERWKRKLGESTYRWLNEAFAALKTVSNDASHRNRDNFDQFESQMIQAITLCLIAYAARNEPGAE